MHIGRKSVIKHTSRASLVAFLLFDAEIVNLTKGKYWQHGIRFQQLYVLWICFYTLKFQLIFLVKWIVLMGASLAVEVKSIKILNNIVQLWYPLQQLKYCSTLLGSYLINLLKQWHQTSIALESLDDCYFVGRKLEIENIKVWFDAVLGHRLWNNDVVALDLVTDENLADCLTLLCGEFLNLLNNT